VIARLALVLLAAMALGQTPRSTSSGPPAAMSPVRLEPQLASREAQFRQLANQLAAARASGAAENQAQEEQALALLDGFVLEALNAPGGPALAALNRKLQSLVTREPAAGEGYRVILIRQSPPAYALLADFGLSGPSAVRIYDGARSARRGAPGQMRLGARIDRYTDRDFLDDYLELVAVDTGSGVFVTVAGRTDSLSTGIFIAWHFDAGRAEKLWSSEILQQSSYETRADGFRLAYCAQTDEERPEICRGMVEDLYRFTDGRWTRVWEKPLAPMK
jgi:hypothetical protein